MRRVAERQWGAIAFAQLREAGFSRGEVRAMQHRGELLRLHPAVYALGHERMTTMGRLHAALLAAGPDAFLSHGTAAAHRGLCRHPLRIEVTVPRTCTPRATAGLRIHRTTIPVGRDEVRMHAELPTATVPRILRDIARTGTAAQVEALVLAAIRAGQFDLTSLREAIRDHPQRPGTGRLGEALRRYLPGREDRRSGLEEDFQNHALADPRLPEPEYNVRLLGYEIDVCWPVQRVTLELDGRPYHVAVRDFDRDRAKDRTLIRHGWRPLRVSDVEWEHDRARVLEDLYATLGVSPDRRDAGAR